MSFVTMNAEKCCKGSIKEKVSLKQERFALNQPKKDLEQISSAMWVMLLL